MKNKKIILDIIMFISMFLLMKLAFTGIAIHEILGITVFILFIIHKLFNFTWIKVITKNMFTKVKVNRKVKVRYIIDLLLFISVFMVILSGIFISQVLFFNLFEYNCVWSDIHHFFAALSFVLIVIHTLLHYKEIKSIIKNKTKNSIPKKIIYYLIVVGMSILPISIIASKTFINYFIKPFKSDNNNSSISNSTNTSDNSTDNQSDDSSDTTTPTLEEYLSKLHCNGCSKHCILTAICCVRGESYVEAATDDYYEQYGTAYNIEDNIELENYTITMI